MSGKDELLLTLNDAPPACHRSGCGWEQMLAYSPGKLATVPAPAPVLAPTPAAVVKKDTPRQGMTTYHNPAYGFSIQYPDTWEYTEPYKQLNNYFQLNGPKGVLRIDYRRATQQERIQRTGTGAGDFVRAGSIQFMGKTLQRDLLVYGGKVKEVFYQGDCEFSVGDLVFTLGLDIREPAVTKMRTSPRTRREKLTRSWSFLRWMGASREALPASARKRIAR